MLGTTAKISLNMQSSYDALHLKMKMDDEPEDKNPPAKTSPV